MKSLVLAWRMPAGEGVATASIDEGVCSMDAARKPPGMMGWTPRFTRRRNAPLLK